MWVFINFIYEGLLLYYEILIFITYIKVPDKLLIQN